MLRRRRISLMDDLSMSASLRPAPSRPESSVIDRPMLDVDSREEAMELPSASSLLMTGIATTGELAPNKPRIVPSALLMDFMDIESDDFAFCPGATDGGPGVLGASDPDRTTDLHNPEKKPLF